MEAETKKLLEALGVYNLPYTELEELYIRDITRDKDPSFYRKLILQKHHNSVPRLRAKLMTLHLESPNSTRSKIRQELLWYQFHRGASVWAQLKDIWHTSTILVYNPGNNFNKVTVSFWRFGGGLERRRRKGIMETFTLKRGAMWRHWKDMEKKSYCTAQAHARKSNPYLPVV